MVEHSVCNILLSFIILFGYPAIHAQEICTDTGNMHLCYAEGVTVSKVFQCDGIRDCRDGSDETTDICKNRYCSEASEYSSRSGDFINVVEARTSRCDYGACISPESVCDGFINCGDCSDETYEKCKNKLCKSTEFQCNYGACIPLAYVCNGLVNCHDASDEMDTGCDKFRKCDNVTGFRCAYGACIRRSQWCNGIANCRDESDESEVECGVGHTYKKHILPCDSQMSDSILPEPVTPGNTDPEDQEGCSRQTVPPGVTVDVIKCTAGSCTSSTTSPFGTIVSAACPSGFMALECKEDYLWYPYEEDTNLPTANICQKTEMIMRQVPSEWCSYKNFHNSAVQILKCGGTFSISYCEANLKAPPGTIIADHCDGSHPQILQCSQEKKWHTQAAAMGLEPVTSGCS